MRVRGSDMESSFDVFLTGELAPGVDRATAVERLAEIFNLQLSVADQLVCGSSRRIKKACNKATALRFRQLLNDAGLSVSVKRHEENPHSTPPVPSPQQEQRAVFEMKTAFPLTKCYSLLFVKPLFSNFALFYC